MIRDEIWSELATATFGAKYVSLYLNQKRKLLSIVDYLSVIFVIGGVAGWYRFDNYGQTWACIIIIAKLAHYFRGNLLLSTEKILELKKFEQYLVFKKIELEELWIKFNSHKINEDQVLKKLKKLKKIELEDKYNIEQINNIKKLNIEASRFRNQYLAKYLNHE